MNPFVNKKDLIPRVIILGCSMYIGFVHETSEKPLRYFDFLYETGGVEEYAKFEKGDMIYPLSLSAYFRMNNEIMKNGKGLKYNLMKKRHEYNTRKYGKIRSNNNTV